MSKDRGIVFEAEVSRAVEPGTTTLYDRSRFANDGTMTNIGWAQLPSGLWYLDGNAVNDWVNIPNDVSIDLVLQLTIELWVKIAALKNWVVPFAKRGAGVPDYQITINAGGTYVFEHAGGVLAANTATAGAWLHLAATYDSGGNCVTYRNGGNAITQASVGALTNTVVPITLNRDGSAGGNYGGCSLAFVRLYNYALSAGQVLKHYEAERSLFGV